MTDRSLRIDIRLAALQHARDYVRETKDLLPLATEIENWLLRNDLGVQPDDRLTLAEILELMLDASSIRVRYIPIVSTDPEDWPEIFELTVTRDGKTTRHSIDCGTRTVEPREFEATGAQ
jgi:hypothetical protein